jgi:hypothetical protein
MVLLGGVPIKKHQQHHHFYRCGKRAVESGVKMLTRKKSVDIPKYDDPLMVVLDVIIEYGKLHREWEKEELARLEKEKLANEKLYLESNPC